MASYGFEEASGSVVADNSGNGNDGALENGGARTTGGFFGRGVEFDGVGGDVNLGGLDVAGSGLTISMWFKANDFGTIDARLLSKSTGSAEQEHWWMISTIGGPNLRFRLKTNDGITQTLISSGPALLAGEWNHVAVTYDETEMIIYQNGFNVGSVAKTGPVAINGAVSAWVADNPGGTQVFDGVIDEVRIYSRALTQPEIETDMNTSIDGGAPLPTPTPTPTPAPDSLILAYGFEEGSGTNITDSSLSGNDGVLENGGGRSVAGQFGEAVEFDGSAGNVDLGGLDIVGTGLTIMAWINPDDFGIVDARIFSKSTGSGEQDHWWMVSTIGGPDFRFRLKTSVGGTSTLISSGPNLNAGQWTHVAVTYDGAFMRIYQGGNLVGTLAKTGTVATNPGIPAWIGNNPAANQSFDGRIDEARIYNRALDQSEIQADMATAIAP